VIRVSRLVVEVACQPVHSRDDSSDSGRVL
jgi:hypothetical protein